MDASRLRRWRHAAALAFVALAACGEHRPGEPTVERSAAAAADARWPSFRGDHASGVADGQDLPSRWDVDTGDNVLWRVDVPGLAHASPVIYDDRIFLATAVSGRDDASFRHGLYGSGDASEDRSVHRWQVLALDRRSGELLWRQTAHEGEPRDKRHIKATYANSTPATDGRHVVALFGSEGLYAYDVDGELLWRHDVGRLDAGAYDAPSYEWGSASSPIIHRDLVIVQADTQDDSFLLAVDLATGEERWRVARDDEPPSWGTPTVYDAGARDEIVCNGSGFIRGYDPVTGAELWRLGGSSDITAPTPIFDGDRIVVASGRRPVKPLFVLRAGASGDISLAAGETASDDVIWSKRGHGPYMPTPITYRDLLYVLNNNGTLGCYDLATGEEHYRERLPEVGGGFSASPVASDGRLFLAGEDGDVLVVAAGTELELLARNAMGGRLMATPAIAGGVLYVRTERQLVALSRTR